MSFPGGCGRTELGRFAVQVIRGRWFSVYASILIMAGAGATYLFGSYSQEIKSSMGYDQSTLNLIGFFKNLGANVGVPAGLIAEVSPTWFLLVISSAMNFSGFFMIWLAITGKIATPKVWQMCAFICIGANSQNFSTTGAVVTSIKNFPESRGVMLGILTGFMGLSGAIITQILLALYGNNDSKSLILLIGWFPAAISAVFVSTIRTMEVARRQPRNELRVFYHFLYVSIALALFLMVVTILQKQFVFSRSANVGSLTTICALLFVLLLITIKEEYALWNQQKQQLEHSSIIISPTEEIVESILPPQPETMPHNSSEIVESIPPAAATMPHNSSEIVESIPPATATMPHNSSEIVESIPPAATMPHNSSRLATIFKKPPRGEDYTILQGLLSIDMSILFIATLFGQGSALTAIDSLGQIGESLGYPTRTISSFVSLVSIWNFLGRIFAGYVSEALVAKWRLPRPLMLTLVLFLLCVSHLMIAFPISGTLYIATVILGFSVGAQMTLVFTLISELFGLKYYSTLVNCGQLASPLGTYVLNVKVTGMLYDKEALKELAKKGMTRSSELTCIGVHCHHKSFIILAAGTFLGALVSLILVMRTRQFYKQDIYKKFRDEPKPTEIDMASSSTAET